MSSALTVFLPACFARSIACDAISSPITSNYSANATTASSLTRAAPAFFIILEIGACGNSLMLFISFNY